LSIVQADLRVLRVDKARNLALLAFVASWGDAPDDFNALPNLQLNNLGNLWKRLHINFVEGGNRSIVQAHLRVFCIDKSRDLPPFPLVTSWRQAAHYLHTLTLF